MRHDFFRQSYRDLICTLDLFLRFRIIVAELYPQPFHGEIVVRRHLHFVHYRIRLVFALLLVSFLLMPLAMVHSQTTQTNALSPFGAVEAYYRPEDAAEAGLGWERIIFEWRQLQPESVDDWETSRWEPWLANAKQANRTVVGLIKNAPQWATGSNIMGAVPLGLDLPLDDPNNRWATFIRYLVTYYSKRWDLHHWIIYNEPDIRPEDTGGRFYEFAGDVEDYYKMVKIAYKVAKKADPKAIIHLAGTSYWYDVVNRRHLYLERYLRLARKDPEARKNGLFFDVLTIHMYGGTDQFWNITNHLKSLPASLGYPKPAWIGELNTRPTQDGAWQIKGLARDSDPEISLDEQASFIIQTTAMSLALGIERVAIYRLYDDSYDWSDKTQYEAWGLIRPDGTRRPGYYALKTATKYFADVTKAQRYKRLGVKLILLEQPGKTTYVLWNETLQPIKVRVAVTNKNKADTVIINPIGKQEKVTYSEDFNGVYEFTLPPCSGSCLIQGEPRILVQEGAPGYVLAQKNNKWSRVR
jgi:hypothetical protein